MSEQNPNNNQNNQQGNPPTDTKQNEPAFDYEKLASIINGKQSVTEETVLKSYFKQQGLSKEEMEQAINSFKEQKAKNTPDIAKLQSDVTAANSARLKAEINQSATLEAIKQGIDIKSIPYLLKMADFKDCTDENGNIKADNLTNAIKTVLDDIPALKGKSQSGGNNSGFEKIGGDGNSDDGTANENELVRKAFGLKPKK